MLRHCSTLLRAAGLAALALYFLGAAGILALRYAVLPNIDHWRPFIATQVSRTLGVPVELGKVQAQWRGLNPSFEVADVRFTDRRGHEVFRLPALRGTLGWRSLLQGQPRFLNLEAIGVDLVARRDRDQRIWVVGQSFDARTDAAPLPAPGAPTPAAEGAAGQPADDDAIRWLGTQRRIVLRDARIRWLDNYRGAPLLALEGVTLRIVNQSGDHRFALTARLPDSLGKSVDVRGAFRPSSGTDQPVSLETGEGKVYVALDDMRPNAWRPWIDMPQELGSGRFSAQAVLSMQGGRVTHLTSDTVVRDAAWRAGPGGTVSAASLRLFLDGPVGAFESLLATVPSHAKDPALADGAPALRFDAQSQGLDLTLPDVFEHALRFEDIRLAGTALRDPAGLLRLDAEHARVRNGDMDLVARGGWHAVAGDPAGSADVSGSFRRVSLPAIARYLPREVDADAREWMRHGLLAGEATNASFVVRGMLQHFPFGEDPAQGDFQVGGAYTGGIIDYLPAEGKTPGWPMLRDMEGKVALHRADLKIQAHSARMDAGADLPIALHDVSAHIPNIEHDAVLHVHGRTQAAAASYLALVHGSPLGKLLDGMLDEASADGTWRVPLALTIPLAEGSDTKVDGAIEFSGGRLRMLPEMPAFTDLKGALRFSETSVRSDGLTGTFLGGPVTVGGGLGGGTKGLQFRGRVTAAALGDYVGVNGMRRLQGGAAYQATVQRGAGGQLAVTLASDLAGLSVDLPPPLGKKAETALPLAASWRPDKNRLHVLEMSLGKEANARLLHTEGSPRGSYFHAGAVGIGQTPATPPEGLSIDVRYPAVDADAWNAVVDEFSTATKGTEAAGRPLLPELVQLRLQSDSLRLYGMALEQLTFTASKPKQDQWRIDVSSSQTAGTLFWYGASGKAAGRVQANFDRLALGAEQQNDASAAVEAGEDTALDDDIDVPAIDLHVKRLRLYGHEVGELSVAGVSEAHGTRWRLDRLSLASPHANLTGKGTWRLRGRDRGLDLDARADIRDLGAYLDQAGFAGIMVGGHGSIDGRLQWRNLPWTFTKRDLSGELHVALDKGRFSNLNSRSARLLELLSLQSVRRLARLDFDPRGLTKEGFPYDKLRATLALDAGVLKTNDYRVVGPVGTIVLGGNTDLASESLDLQAVVIPNLDVSGAAVAAAIAVNPVIGLGAFVTQWLLQAPLAKAMTVQYQIKGNWDDPKIEEATRLDESVKRQLKKPAPKEAGRNDARGAEPPSP